MKYVVIKVAQAFLPVKKLTQVKLLMFLPIIMFFIITQAGTPLTRLDRVMPVLHNDKIHEITVHHPGMKEDKDCQLIERKDDLGKTIDFYMDVESVICLDGKCKIVHVRLLWNRVGNYKKYELANNVELEKKDGEAFTIDDYAKLQRILEDENSILEEFALGQIVDMKKDGAGIDGISGATILTDETASVKGAAWTCYTLWHWANGEITNIIKGITERSITKKELHDFFKMNDDGFKKIALEQFKERKMYDDTTLNLVTNTIENLNIKPVKLAISYIKDAPTETFYNTLQPLFEVGTESRRILYLNALLDKEKDVSGNLLKTINQYILQLKTYQEVNLVINFLEKKEIKDLKINQALLAFLKHENIIIARRIYWFLSEQALNPKGKKEVKAFRRKHKMYHRHSCLCHSATHRQECLCYK